MKTKTVSRSTITNVVVVVVALLAAYFVYKYQMDRYAALQAQKEMEIKKNAVIEVISKLEKNLSSYKRLLFDKDSGALAKAISDSARKNGVMISSINPMPRVSQEYFDAISVNLNVETRSYHYLGKFISELERAPEIFRVNIMNVTPKDQAQSGTGLRVNLTVTTLIYKD